MAQKPARWGRRIALGFVALLVVATGGYFAARAALKPDPAKLGTWGSDLDKALAEAKGSGRLVLLKAGSEY